MRSSTEQPTRRRGLRAPAILLATALAGSGALGAEAAPGQGGLSSLAFRRAYLDLGGVAMGAISSALHTRAGVELAPGRSRRPEPSPLSLGLEAELYYAAASDTTLLQADLLTLARWRPRPPKGLSLTAGLGILAFSSTATAEAGGPSAYADRRYMALLAAEASWTWQLLGGPLFFEPALRGYLAGGPARRGGSALPPSLAIEGWTLVPSADLGLRLGWSLY